MDTDTAPTLWFLVAVSRPVYGLVSGGHVSSGLSPGFWWPCLNRPIPWFLVSMSQVVYPLVSGGYICLKRSIPWFLVAMSQAVYPLVSGDYPPVAQEAARRARMDIII